MAYFIYSHLTLDVQDFNIWYLLNILIIPVLLGYFGVRFVTQFKIIIMTALSISIFIIFVLLQIDFVAFTIDGDKINRIYEALKVSILDFGLIPFMGLLSGAWISFLQIRRSAKEYP